MFRFKRGDDKPLFHPARQFAPAALNAGFAPLPPLG
jgi:hypothetical protein